MKITIETVGNDVQIPAYKREGDAGMDLRAYEFKSLYKPAFNEKGEIAAEECDNTVNDYDRITIMPRERALIGTGVKVALPEGYELQVRPRSGLALNDGVTVLNSPGTVDCNYRGEVGVIIINHGFLPVHIDKNDRIAQAVFTKYKKVELVTGELDTTERGQDGFGSSGVK